MGKRLNHARNTRGSRNTQFRRKGFELSKSVTFYIVFLRFNSIFVKTGKKKINRIFWYFPFFNHRNSDLTTTVWRFRASVLPQMGFAHRPRRYSRRTQGIPQMRHQCDRKGRHHQNTTENGKRWRWHRSVRIYTAVLLKFMFSSARNQGQSFSRR